eukprot:6098080-Prorocentrum_lima.AAC.1
MPSALTVMSPRSHSNRVSCATNQLLPKAPWQHKSPCGEVADARPLVLVAELGIPSTLARGTA